MGNSESNNNRDDNDDGDTSASDNDDSFMPRDYLRRHRELFGTMSPRGDIKSLTSKEGDRLLEALTKSPVEFDEVKSFFNENQNFDINSERKYSNDFSIQILFM